MAGNGDPGEDVATVTLVDASAVASNWEDVGKQLDNIGHQVAALKATGAGFPDKINKALFGLGQGCTSVGARWTAAAADVQRQHDDVDVPKAADYKTKTKTLADAKAMESLLTSQVNAGRISPTMSESAKSSVAAARAARTKVLDDAVNDTAGRVQALPGHGTAASEAVQTARGTMVTQTGSGPSLAPIEQVKPPVTSSGGKPLAPVESGIKPTSGSPSKPSGEKPTAEKSAVDGPSDGKAQSPQTSLPQSPAQQQGQQGAQPQQGGGAQPAGTAPTGAGAQRSPGALPVSQPTPVRTTSGGEKGGGVRPTPSAPVQSPAQRAGITGKGGSPLGSGGGATGAGGTASAVNNKSGGGASPNSGGSNAATTGAGRAPMGGMMGGAGAHGAGGQGGQVRPKGEVKSDDKRLRGEDVAEQALGGIIRDGDDGKPVTPPVPGSNGDAPVPPSRPGS